MSPPQAGFGAKGLVTREERRKFGRLRRDAAGRVSLGNWKVGQRTFDWLELLRKSQEGRIANLLPIKWARMALSPFGFYRGAVPLMAADLSRLPSPGIDTQICGDAHVRNLGAMTGEDGRLIFDINDFDETIRGPWEWDVRRMAASLVLAGREAGNSDEQCRQAVQAMAEQYREAMWEFSEMSVIDLARYQVFRHIKVSPVLSVLRKAERATPRNNLDHLTELRHGRHIFCEHKPLQRRVGGAEAARVIQGLKHYVRSLLPERRHFFAHYQPADVAFRVVGTGSVGVHDYVVLMFAEAIDDPLFMQIKEEVRSAYAGYLPRSRDHGNEGRRTAEGVRAMVVLSDIFLGWTSFEGRDYLVRQLHDHKASIDDEDLRGAGLVQYAQVCGELLSKGHARSGDPCLIAGYLGRGSKFADSMAGFGVAYADQTTRDYQEFRRAIRDGKFKAAPRSVALNQLAPSRARRARKTK